MTFFSGTDTATLKEEGKDTNHFVSLIVNNAGKYTAAITRKVKCSQKGDYSISYNTFNNESIVSKNKPFEQTEEYIEYFPLEITVEEIPVKPKSELELRLEAVRKNSNSYINKKYNTYNPLMGKLPDISIKEKEPKNEVYIQKSLFEDEESKVGKKEDEEFDSFIDYDNDHINPTIINNMVTQIITGDIFSIYKTHIDLNKWVENMEHLYSRRFKEDEDLTLFSYWAESFVDFLESEIEASNLQDKGIDYIDAIWANDMINALQKFPENKYLKIFITTFERWLL